MKPHRLHQLMKQVNHSQQPIVFKQLYKQLYKDMELLLQYRWLHANTIISTVRLATRLYQGACTNSTIIYSEYIRVSLYSAVSDEIPAMTTMSCIESGIQFPLPVY
jgi:hypothetical protein